MPIYSYVCKTCQHSDKILLSKKEIKVPCKCGSEMEYVIPSTVESVTYEKKDHYRGVQLPKNNASNLKSRMIRHHDKYEITKKIDEHGLDEAQRLGWTKKDKRE